MDDPPCLNKHQRYYQRNRENILAKAAKNRALKKELKQNEIPFIQQEEPEHTSREDVSDSSYDNMSSDSADSTNLTPSQMSHASSDAEPVNGISAVLHRQNSKMPAMERVAILAQDCDLWRSKWGGIPNWIAIEYADNLLYRLDRHRQRGRDIIAEIAVLSYSPDLPSDPLLLRRLFQKLISISEIVHAGIEQLSLYILHWFYQDEEVEEVEEEQRNK
ncbi:hypothetical protein B0H17DRAFT_1151309 [Mycena rosella]|uniref:Uncharacterized protein n=1 Tax=Mycena rosella TaxID=1033263 RepID=A0AAD7FH72_MYCRO|nr:hypothetical protein B0H17DRAFT_1151309 [Mycena rosella]